MHSKQNCPKYCVNDLQKKAVDWARGEIWDIYADLKIYKSAPTSEQAGSIEQRFVALCSKHTDYTTLNLALKRMGENQHEFLRVLDKPYLPLHNNLSERDIRDYVKKRTDKPADEHWDEVACGG